MRKGFKLHHMAYEASRNDQITISGCSVEKPLLQPHFAVNLSLKEILGRINLSVSDTRTPYLVDFYFKNHLKELRSKIQLVITKYEGQIRYSITRIRFTEDDDVITETQSFCGSPKEELFLDNFIGICSTDIHGL